jgi:hypothetical protein
LLVDAVVGPGILNLTPDAMHAAIKEHGGWRIAPYLAELLTMRKSG